ncbi:hypothetical protein ACF1A9_20385 [Streptomyces sp. NPDC014872]|uniref:hypothetical protein n=1 Tax=Streptomyces sp. NPDC014872 TaxID=3364926 RepID=UPI0037013617
MEPRALELVPIYPDPLGSQKTGPELADYVDAALWWWSRRTWSSLCDRPQRLRSAVLMRDLERQLVDVAELLDDVGSLPPLAITFACDREEGPYVIVATPHQLPLADQRLAVDQIAARVEAVPKVGEVLTGRYGASVRGRWAHTVVVAVTNAAPISPECLPFQSVRRPPGRQQTH